MPIVDLDPKIVLSFPPEQFRGLPALCHALQQLDGALVLIGLHLHPQALACLDAGVACLTGEKNVPCRARLDSNVAAQLILTEALPRLQDLCARTHGYDLRSGLFPGFHEQLRIAERALGASPAGYDASPCLHSLAHLVRTTLADNFMSRWMIDACTAHERGEVVWEDSDYRPTEGVPLPCPMCHMPADCSIAFEESAAPVFWVERMLCRDCGFSLRPPHRALSEVLFADQMKTERGKILKEYGVGVNDPF